MSKKIITSAMAEQMSLSDFLNALHGSGLDKEHAARVRIEAPCGCIGGYEVRFISDDTTGCINRERAPTEIN